MMRGSVAKLINGIAGRMRLTNQSRRELKREWTNMSHSKKAQTRGFLQVRFPFEVAK